MRSIAHDMAMAAAGLQLFFFFFTDDILLFSVLCSKLHSQSIGLLVLVLSGLTDRFFSPFFLILCS